MSVYAMETPGRINYIRLQAKQSCEAQTPAEPNLRDQTAEHQGKSNARNATSTSNNTHC